MPDPSLTITIDRTGMAGSPAPLVLVGNRADGSSNTALGVSGYREPSKRVRYRNAPPSDYVHGDLPLGWTWDQALLTFSVMPVDATEDQLKDAIDELEAAVSRLTYAVTVEVGDAGARIWTCTVGELSPVRDRSYTDLRLVRPVWSVSIPCHPVPEIGG